MTLISSLRGGLPSRTEVCTGTCSRSTAGPDELRYIRGAIVPRADWRTPVSEELEVFRCARSAVPLCVERLRLSAAIWDSFEDLRRTIRSTESLALARNQAASDRWHEAIASVTDLLRDFTADSGKSFAGVGLCVHPPGLPTVTFDESRNGFIGLHLDHWYDSQTPEDSPNRFCINLGYESRYFLFSPRSISALRQARSHPGMNLADSELARAYLRAFPDSPVIRLRVDPGEAYIAPTECISHDGSTQGQSGWDLTLTVRGRFMSPSLGASLTEVCL